MERQVFLKCSEVLDSMRKHPIFSYIYKKSSEIQIKHSSKRISLNSGLMRRWQEDLESNKYRSLQKWMNAIEADLEQQFSGSSVCDAVVSEQIRVFHKEATKRNLFPGQIGWGKAVSQYKNQIRELSNRAPESFRITAVPRCEKPKVPFISKEEINNIISKVSLIKNEKQISNIERIISSNQPDLIYEKNNIKISSLKVTTLLAIKKYIEKEPLVQ